MKTFKGLVLWFKLLTKRAKKEDFFIPENRGAVQNVFSTSGKYRLEIALYKTNSGYWGYSQGTVFCQDKQIAIIHRNYSAFPFAFVENHADSHDYLICGSDYQCQTIVQLTTGKLSEYPKTAEGKEHVKEGIGFCWASIEPSPNKKYLGVSGCHWACPYEVRFYDFSNPMEELPLLSDGLPPEDYADTLFRWREDGTAEIGYVRDVRKSDGVLIDDLPQEVWSKIPDEEWGEKEYIKIWTPPF